MADESLPKSERLCGLSAVGNLFEHGKSLSAGCLRIKFLQHPESSDPARIVVSVPKRNFKRAVKRNLLKRRIRESYRRQKGLLPAGIDVLFIYTLPTVLPYEAVYADMTAALQAIAAALPDGCFPQGADN